MTDTTPTHSFDPKSKQSADALGEGSVSKGGSTQSPTSDNKTIGEYVRESLDCNRISRGDSPPPCVLDAQESSEEGGLSTKSQMAKKRWHKMVRVTRIARQVGDHQGSSDAPVSTSDPNHQDSSSENSSSAVDHSSESNDAAPHQEDQTSHDNPESGSPA